MAEAIRLPTTYGPLDGEVGTTLPIPPEMIEQAFNNIDKEAEAMLEQYEGIAKVLTSARDRISSIVESVRDVEPYRRYVGVDGGIGHPGETIGYTYSSVVGVAYPSNYDVEPSIKVTPVKIPASLGAPHQNYLAVWRQKYEYLVALHAIEHGKTDHIMFDGTIVPSIFIKYLRSSEQYAKLTPHFLDIFKECFVDYPHDSLATRIIKSNVPIVGIPKVSRSRHITKMLEFYDMDIPEAFSDIMACSVLLKPGEFVKPIPYRELWLSEAQLPELGQLHWDWITKEARNIARNTQVGLEYPIDSIPEIAEHTLVTYFKPFAGAPAMRIEILDKNAEQIDKILKTIQTDYNQTVRLPFCIYMADRYSKSGSFLPSMVKSVLESRMNALSRRKKLTDQEFLWFTNLTFTTLGTLEA